MATPSEVGARAELEVAAALTRSGRRVYLPFFDAHGRVDLAFGDDAGLHAVQVKSARLVGDVVFFRTCSNTNNDPRDYEGEVDFFGLYCPELDEVFLVPAVGLPTRGASLRLGPARNNQAKGVRWAEEYRVRPAQSPLSRDGAPLRSEA